MRMGNLDEARATYIRARELNPNILLGDPFFPEYLDLAGKTEQASSTSATHFRPAKVICYHSDSYVDPDFRDQTNWIIIDQHNLGLVTSDCTTRRDHLSTSLSSLINARRDMFAGACCVTFRPVSPVCFGGPLEHLVPHFASALLIVVSVRPRHDLGV